VWNRTQHLDPELDQLPSRSGQIQRGSREEKLIQTQPRLNFQTEHQGPTLSHANLLTPCVPAFHERQGNPRELESKDLPTWVRGTRPQHILPSRASWTACPRSDVPSPVVPKKNSRAPACFSCVPCYQSGLTCSSLKAARYRVQRRPCVKERTRGTWVRGPCAPCRPAPCHHGFTLPSAFIDPTSDYAPYRSGTVPPPSVHSRSPIVEPVAPHFIGRADQPV
jgi:hypothetical protein